MSKEWLFRNRVMAKPAGNFLVNNKQVMRNPFRDNKVEDLVRRVQLMEVSLQQWQNATKDCMDTIENFSKIHQPPPNIPDQVDSALSKAILKNAAFMQVQAVANTTSAAVQSLKETVDELKANSILSAPTMFELTVNQMMALPAAADLHKLMHWLSKEDPEDDSWNVWWDAKVAAKQPRKMFATSTLLVHRIMSFTSHWQADPAALSLEQFTLELTTMSALLEMLELPFKPEQRFQKLLQKVFKQAPLTLRQILSEWNSIWTEDAVIHLNTSVFGTEELSSVMDNRVTGWHPQKFTTPKLTPGKYPEDFREVFDRCKSNDNTTVWNELQDNQETPSDGGMTDGEASMEEDLNDSRATESEESDTEAEPPTTLVPPVPKKVKKTPKYQMDTDFLPAKPTLFQRPQTYQDIVDAQMNSWAAKQASKRK